MRVSGPAVDATGLGPGFSGSPILCPGADGVARNIGAISETIGEYGGRLGAGDADRVRSSPSPPLPPAATRTRSIGARSLAGPLTIAGLRPSLGRAFERAARKAGPHADRLAGQRLERRLPAPAARARRARSRSGCRPATSCSARSAPSPTPTGRTSGSSATRSTAPGAARSSCRTPTSTRSSTTRSPCPRCRTYKLGSPGNDVGTITSDGPNAVAGTVGALPPSFPLRVTAKDLDTGRARSAVTQLADEGDVGLPTGGSALGHRRRGGRRRGRRRDPRRRAGPPERRAVHQDHAARAAQAAARLQPLRGRRRDAERARRARPSPTSPTPSACSRATASACCTRRRSRSACACAAGCARRTSRGVSGPARARRGATIAPAPDAAPHRHRATTTHADRAHAGAARRADAGRARCADGHAGRRRAAIPTRTGGDLSVVFERTSTGADDGGPQLADGSCAPRSTRSRATTA